MKHLFFFVFTLLLAVNTAFGQVRLDKDSLKTSFPVLGLTLGTPVGLHLVGGYYFDGWGGRASAGYFGNIYGIQFNFIRNLTRSRKFSHNVSLTGGVRCKDMDPPGLHQSNPAPGATEVIPYTGIAYDFNIAGMFFEGGVAFAGGTNPNPTFTFQVGYIHEFNK